MAKKSPLAEKLDDVRERIAKACAAAKREVAEVTLIAVTKTAAPEQIREIIQLGVGDLAESRVQVLTQRAGQLNEFFQRQQTSGSATVAPKLRWHMIGHLQRNKVKPIIPLANVIHSVDSLRLAEEIDTYAGKLGKKMPVFMQINASEETSKYGVAVGASVHLGEQIDSMPNVQLIGLMTMGAIDAPAEKNRAVFARTREIFEEMKWHKIGGDKFRHLSMGMSGDFEQAIAEGATMVRVGTSLFGGKAAEESQEGE